MKETYLKIDETQKKKLQDWLDALNEFNLERIIPFQEMGKGYILTDHFERIHQETNHIQASIIGNMEYKVELLFENGAIYSSCSCPVSGICKHQSGLLLYFATK